MSLDRIEKVGLVLYLVVWLLVEVLVVWPYHKYCQILRLYLYCDMRKYSLSPREIPRAEPIDFPRA